MEILAELRAGVREQLFLITMLVVLVREQQVRLEVWELAQRQRHPRHKMGGQGLVAVAVLEELAQVELEELAHLALQQRFTQCAIQLCIFSVPQHCLKAAQVDVVDLPVVVTAQPVAVEVAVALAVESLASGLATS